MLRHFVVPLKDLDNGPKTLDDVITVDWLRVALSDTEATPAGVPGHLSLTLSKNGHEVLVRGQVEVSVEMACARTLAPLTLELKPEVFLLLSRRAAEPAPARHRKKGREVAVKPNKKQRLREVKGAGSAPRDRKNSHGGWESDPELSDPQAALDTFSGEEIVLDSFVREFILLELPMFPVREDLPSIKLEARATPLATPDREGAVDPRLRPLQELRARMDRDKSDKE